MRDGDKTVRCNFTGHVATITIDRPAARNALNAVVRREFVAICERLKNMAGLRALVITGAGERAFCAGADIKEMAAAPDVDAVALRREFINMHRALGSLDRPVIAAINGLCLGGGLELALVCDIRIASTQAIFGFPEIRLATIPGGGGTVRLQRLIGRGAARALCLTGDAIDAERAFTLGLVAEVVAPHALATRAMELARQLASYSRAAMSALRLALDGSASLPLEAALDVEKSIVAQLSVSADRVEGMRAFAEKREARFEGLERA